MADPFSIVGLVSASLKGILQAKEFIDTIHRAPRSIETLRDELSTIAGLLRELGHLADRTDELNLNRIVREPLANCDKVSKHIEKLIQPYVKTSGGITKWGRFAFGFKKSDVLLLQRDLSACKQNLTLAITSADLITTRKVVRGLRRVQNHFRIPSSSVAESDIDERNHGRIEEWVDETETVVEEEEPLDPAGESSPLGKSITVRVESGGFRGGETLSIGIQKNYTIANLKAGIALRTGVPETRQRLYLKGRSLDNKSTVEQYGIKDGGVISATFDGFYSYRN